MSKKTIIILGVILMATLVDAQIIEDFEDGIFLDGNPVNWYCESAQGYDCEHQISNLYRKNGSYSIRIGASTDQPSKFAIDLQDFQYETWYGAWMMEQGENRQDHSMFELFVDGALDSASVIREVDNKFQVYTEVGYQEMEGTNCKNSISEQWYFLRLKMHTNLLMDAEVYNQNGDVICSKYNYNAHVSNEPTKIRILGDQSVPYTYWDNIVIGNEIPLNNSPPIEPPPEPPPTCEGINITGIQPEQEQSVKTLLTALFQLIGVNAIIK